MTEYLTIVSSAGHGLSDFTHKYGIELAPLARSLGLSHEIFEGRAVRIKLDLFARLLQVLSTVTSDECFGLRFGLAHNPGDIGPFGFALMHAPTLRHALDVMRKYQPIIVEHAYFQIDSGPQAAIIEWRCKPLIQMPDQYVDHKTILDCRVIRRFVGAAWFPKRIALERSQPGNRDLHRKMMGTAVQFAAPANRIEFVGELLDTPSKGYDIRIFNLMIEACERQLEALPQVADIRLQIIEKISQALPKRSASLMSVAAKLDMGERSLQRRLSEMGTTFEKLVEETRRNLSDRLLATTDLSLGEISHLCGYSSPSAYSRAAKGWYGMGPAAFRLQSRQAVD